MKDGLTATSLARYVLMLTVAWRRKKTAMPRTYRPLTILAAGASMAYGLRGPKMCYGIEIASHCIFGGVNLATCCICCSKQNTYKL